MIENRPNGIVQFQVCKPWTSNGDDCIFGLADDGRVYIWSVTKNHWEVFTYNIFRHADGDAVR